MDVKSAGFRQLNFTCSTRIQKNQRRWRFPYSTRLPQIADKQTLIIFSFSSSSFSSIQISDFHEQGFYNYFYCTQFDPLRSVEFLFLTSQEIPVRRRTVFLSVQYIRYVTCYLEEKWSQFCLGTERSRGYRYISYCRRLWYTIISNGKPSQPYRSQIFSEWHWLTVS